MYISFSGNPLLSYTALKARSTQSEVTVGGNAGAASPAKSAKGLAGKLNAIEHSTSEGIKPQHIRQVLQKTTGLKVRDIDIDQVQFSRTDSTADSTQLTVTQDSEGVITKLEQMHLDSLIRSLSAQGMLTTKDGEQITFDLKLSSTRVSAEAATMSYQSNLPPADETTIEGNVDTAV